METNGHTNGHTSQAGKPKRRYSDEDRASALAALAANGGNASLTGRQLGIPVRTIRAWAFAERHPEAAVMCHDKKLPLAEKLDLIAHQIADAMPDKITSASLSQLAVTMGVSIEKALLLRGQATVISENKHDVSDNLKSHLEALAAERSQLNGDV